MIKVYLDGVHVEAKVKHGKIIFAVPPSPGQNTITYQHISDDPRLKQATRSSSAQLFTGLTQAIRRALYA